MAEKTGVGEWSRIIYQKRRDSASFGLWMTSVGDCQFVDVKPRYDDRIWQACLIAVNRYEHKKQSEGDKDFWWEEIVILHPDGTEHEVLENDYYFRPNYDANNRAKLLKPLYLYRRDLLRLEEQKKEIEKRIAAAKYELNRWLQFKDVKDAETLQKLE